MLRTLRLINYKTIALILAIICAVLISVLTVTYTEAKSLDLESNNYTYFSIKIEPEQSFEDIASRYNIFDNLSNEEYIGLIKNINSLSSSNLHPGCYLTLIK